MPVCGKVKKPVNLLLLFDIGDQTLKIQKKKLALSLNCNFWSENLQRSLFKNLF